MNQDDKKKGAKLRANMSFRELVQRIVQRDAVGPEQKLKKPKQKKAAPKTARRRSKA